jgi:hypothetical protein
MGGLRRAYPPGFRRRMVELVRAGRTPEEQTPRVRADGAVDCGTGFARRTATRAGGMMVRPVSSVRS